MNRNYLFVWLFVLSILIQVFIFNKISISIYLMPIVYPVVIMLLPTKRGQLYMLIAGLIVGLSSDLLMGFAGLATITTLFMAYTRRGLLTITMGRDAIVNGSIPSYGRFGVRKYLRYSTLFVLLNNTIFFTLESLDIVEWSIVALRIFASSILSLVSIWLMTMLFESALRRDLRH